MSLLSSEQRAELSHQLQEFGKTASSARQIAEEESRIRQKIEYRERVLQKEYSKYQKVLNVQKRMAEDIKKQVESADASARTNRITTWVSIGIALISLFVSIFHK